MDNKQTFIDYLIFSEGANQEQAEETFEIIQNRIADGESYIDILEDYQLPIDLADLL